MILQNKSNCSLGILSNPKHSLADRLAELFVKLVPKQFLLVVHLYNLISGRFAAASGYVGILFGQILGGKVGIMLKVYGRLVSLDQPGLNTKNLYEV